MTTALFREFLYDDSVIPGNASGTALTITKGDWVAWSGAYIIAANSGTIAAGYYKVSGVGVALANNPWYDELGVARPNTALPILRRGVIRASGAVSALGDGTDWTLGVPMFPAKTGSGIVGQTGATGMGTTWMTAAFGTVSASTGANNVASGVGILVGMQGGSTGKYDIVLSPQRADYY